MNTIDIQEMHDELKEIERYFGFMGRHKLEGRFEDEFYDLIYEFYFEKYPRRKKRPKFNMKFQEENADIIDEAKDIILERAQKFMEKVTIRYDELKKFFKTIELPTGIDGYNLVYKLSNSVYSSQGFGKDKYTESFLAKYKNMLRHYGYNAYITYDYADDNKRYGHKYFKLKANCPEWVLTAILLRIENSVYEECVKRANTDYHTNQLVYEQEQLVNWI